MDSARTGSARRAAHKCGVPSGLAFFAALSNTQDQGAGLGGGRREENKKYREADKSRWGLPLHILNK